MALLGTYVNAGPACLVQGGNCFAHSLPTTPDFVQFVQQTDGGANVCMPVLVSRNATTAYVTGRPANVSAEGCFQAFNATIR